MITGFNTDIDFNGKVFHVQTEDRGLKNPIVESLVYSGGEIVTSRKTPYDDLLNGDELNEAELLHRMEAQHRELIREIRNGTHAPEELRPFGHGIVTNRSFDEVVLGFMNENFALEGLELALAEPEVIWAGERSTLRLQVLEPTSERPVGGATVVVRLVDGDRQETELLEARTDEEGWIEAACMIPKRATGDVAIVCEADASGVRATLERPVRRRSERSV